MFYWGFASVSLYVDCFLLYVVCRYQLQGALYSNRGIEQKSEISRGRRASRVFVAFCPLYSKRDDYINGSLVLLAIVSTMCIQHVQLFLVLNRATQECTLFTSPEVAEFWCESDQVLSLLEYQEFKRRRDEHFRSNHWIYDRLRGIRRTNHYPSVLNQPKILTDGDEDPDYLAWMALPGPGQQLVDLDDMATLRAQRQRTLEVKTREEEDRKAKLEAKRQEDNRKKTDDRRRKKMEKEQEQQAAAKGQQATAKQHQPSVKKTSRNLIATSRTPTSSSSSVTSISSTARSCASSNLTSLESLSVVPRNHGSAASSTATMRRIGTVGSSATMRRFGESTSNNQAPATTNTKTARELELASENERLKEALAKQKLEIEAANAAQNAQLRQQLYDQQMTAAKEAEERSKKVEADFVKKMTDKTQHDLQLKMAEERLQAQQARQTERMQSQLARQDELWAKAQSRAQFIAQVIQVNAANDQQHRHTDETFQDERAMKKQRLKHDLDEDRLANKHTRTGESRDREQSHTREMASLQLNAVSATTAVVGTTVQEDEVMSTETDDDEEDNKEIS